jgi:hypothetical protein
MHCTWQSEVKLNKRLIRHRALSRFKLSRRMARKGGVAGGIVCRLAMVWSLPSTQTRANAAL